jgi:hypothetical protein
MLGKELCNLELTSANIFDQIIKLGCLLPHARQEEGKSSKLVKWVKYF